MKLKHWQQSKQFKNKHLADLFGVDQSYITYLLQGKRKPSPSLAERIEQATGGEVTRFELLYPDQTQSGGDPAPSREGAA